MTDFKHHFCTCAVRVHHTVYLVSFMWHTGRITHCLKKKKKSLVAKPNERWLLFNTIWTFFFFFFFFVELGVEISNIWWPVVSAWGSWLSYDVLFMHYSITLLHLWLFWSLALSWNVVFVVPFSSKVFSSYRFLTCIRFCVCVDFFFDIALFWCHVLCWVKQTKIGKGVCFVQMFCLKEVGLTFSFLFF